MLKYINKRHRKSKARIKKVVQFKGGGVVHGPKVRSHNKKIPSKVKTGY